MLLSHTLFKIFLERILSDALEEHDGRVSIGGRTITYLRFAYDIDALAEEEQEQEALVESLDKICTRYSKDRVKHDSFRVFNAFVTRFSCVCMKRVLKRVDSRFSRYKRVSQQPIKSALQKREKNAFGPDFAQKISTNQKHLFAFANDVENAKIANPSWPIRS